MDLALSWSTPGLETNKKLLRDLERAFKSSNQNVNRHLKGSQKALPCKDL